MRMTWGSVKVLCPTKLGGLRCLGGTASRPSRVIVSLDTLDFTVVFSFILLLSVVS